MACRNRPICEGIQGSGHGRCVRGSPKCSLLQREKTKRLRSWLVVRRLWKLSGEKLRLYEAGKDIAWARCGKLNIFHDRECFLDRCRNGILNRLENEGEQYSAYRAQVVGRNYVCGLDRTANRDRAPAGLRGRINRKRQCDYRIAHVRSSQPGIQDCAQG